MQADDESGLHPSRPTRGHDRRNVQAHLGELGEQLLRTIDITQGTGDVRATDWDDIRIAPLSLELASQLVGASNEVTAVGMDFNRVRAEEVEEQEIARVLRKDSRQRLLGSAHHRNRGLLRGPGGTRALHAWRQRG